MFYLWNAYHYAKTSDDPAKDHLTYARILRFMASEAKLGHSEYERYRDFVLPALQEYEAAVNSGQKVESNELRTTKFDAKSLDYKLSHEVCSEENWNEAIALIENGNLINEMGFEFHDSKPLKFELISDKQAKLKLQFNNLLAIFRFDNIGRIKIDTEPEIDWISDFCCYKSENSEFIIFDIEFYYIVCRKVVLEKLVDFNA